MSFTIAQIAAACVEFGPQVEPLPAGVDGVKLLWALSGNESSFGKNVSPRHEPAFDIGGAYSKSGNMRVLLEEYGSAAACSYGPWQVLLTNAATFSPSDLSDITTAAQASVSFLNSLLRRYRPLNLVQIGQCWNHGCPTGNPSPGVVAYTDELQHNYQIPIPEGVA